MPGRDPGELVGSQGATLRRCFFKEIETIVC
jgi:hypothetical protein